MEGNKDIRGGNGIADGQVSDSICSAAMETVRIRGFGHLEEADARFLNFDSSCSHITFYLLTILTLNKR